MGGGWAGGGEEGRGGEGWGRAARGWEGGMDGKRRRMETSLATATVVETAALYRCPRHREERLANLSTEQIRREKAEEGKTIEKIEALRQEVGGENVIEMW